ncbi:hypothetical protein SKAU_G00410410 [Synaphobranchus kaupii]|uniref:CCHC-type domain-containing protein n=1 Tax=Synaphobranchus kaupii TaxID=118154 RepID=A0A9Q1IBL9_SYNKA|nr:hypothetical protein SKAU_G00410410 [Synaphobranchus kaupii]
MIGTSGTRTGQDGSWRGQELGRVRQAGAGQVRNQTGGGCLGINQADRRQLGKGTEAGLEPDQSEAQQVRATKVRNGREQVPARRPQGSHGLCGVPRTGTGGNRRRGPSSDEKSKYGALVGAPRRRFGQCTQPGLLRSELGNRRRKPGEPLRALANDIESLARRAYAHMPPSVQGELAREKFLQALTPTELRIQTQLAHPKALQKALELALEREIIAGVVRTVVESSPPEDKPTWAAELTELIRAVSLQARCDMGTHTRSVVCWGCGHAGHRIRQCPDFVRAPGNGSGST